MPDKMNLDELKLLYCEFQKYEVMTMTVLGGQPKNKNKKKTKTKTKKQKKTNEKKQNKNKKITHANTSYKATKHIERTFLNSDYY